MNVKRLALGLWLPLALLVSWQVLASAGILDALFFPPPSALLIAAGRMIASGELGGQIRVTLVRMLTGFLAGSLAGLLCGLLMGAVTAVRHSLEPLISALYSTPKLTLLPMLMLFLGVGDSARILLIAIGCFVLTAVHGLDAVRSINFTYVELAINYGAGPLAVFRKVYLPACLPQVFTGLRLSLGRALVMTISVELVGSSDGLGSMIWMAWQTFATEKLYVAVFVTAASGALFHKSLQRLEARLIPWRGQDGRA